MTKFFKKNTIQSFFPKNVIFSYPLDLNRMTNSEYSEGWRYFIVDLFHNMTSMRFTKNFGFDKYENKIRVKLSGDENPISGISSFTIGCIPLYLYRKIGIDCIMSHFK